MTSISENITESNKAEAALHESEAKFRSLIQNSSDIIGIFEPDGTIRYESPSVERILGYKPEELIGKNAFDFIHPDDISSNSDSFKYLVQNLGATVLVESRFRCKDGSWCFLESTGSNLLDEPSVRGIVINSRDITDRKLAEEQLVHDALHDVLTGLPNRALFMDRLRRAVEYSKRHSDHLFAVLFLDLDRFKFINDSLGHTFGDQLLVIIAQRLIECLRPTDIAARFGGDEFIILLEGIQDISDTVRVVERIQEKLLLPVALSGQEIFTTVSIGISLSGTGYEQPEELLRNADIAMYRAKARGKACYEIFNTDMHVQIVERLQLENDLRRAIERQEFQVYYQPIVSLKTGSITGFEALVRWLHPEQGIVFPQEFMPIAQETGLIIPIDEWVLREACRQTKQWQEEFLPESTNLDEQPLGISINLCSLRFSQQKLLEEINQVLQETGLDAKSLKLEITESVIMDNGENATTMLKQLRNLGIELAIDDFGTGYSSLGRLHHFPINGLKIDQSFVSGRGAEEGNLHIVETIVTLSRKLGVDVTAEGVETPEQLQILRDLKCEYGQGYFFSKPLDSKAAKALIITNPQW
ncbi:putative bifunctional diguanylate cyclase/phosphodiesterase [Anabaena subtropica]|uniref:EAL domain-containing protein n=1 Tax=Anabaena subtropica FACHB-260 TaxID=2692884 RepID=A0ABR8CST1_9NOST|nr:EAL domain-containing protein [Anabaena subtropica]MBD2345851.1 EAL domain-containing protein [Anabaena subtropica FACHB-260]